MMSHLVKIGIFVGFLIVLLAWAFSSLKLSKKFVKDLLRGKTFFTMELILLLSILGLFAFIWMLSGFFNIVLIGLFLVGAHVGIVITGILWALLGSPGVVWGPRAMSAGGEFGLKHVGLFWAMMAFAFIVVFIGYPVVAGIIYFGHSIPSEQATYLIFKITLVGLFVAGWVVLLPSIVWQLLSENLDEDTRTRILVTQIGGLCTNALFLSLIMWSFGIVSGGYSFAVGGIPLTISPLLLIILVSFFVFAFLLPYFCGFQRAKKWREQLMQKKQTWLDDLLDIFEFPTSSSFLSKIEQLNAKVEVDKTQFTESDKMLILAAGFDQVKSPNDIDPAMRDLAQAYQKSRQLDPRFSYLDFLNEFQEEIKESVTELMGYTEKAKVTERVHDYAKAFRTRKDELTETIKTHRQTKPLVWVVLAFLISPFVAQILSEFAKRVSSALLQAPGP